MALKVITLPKGKHRSWFPRIKLLWKPTSMHITFRFDGSAIYSLNDADQLDWNKLAGYTRGLHHKNSIRIGWRWNIETKKIDICKYMYKDGVREIFDVEEVKIGTTYTRDISIPVGKYTKWGYMLWPYFGGNKKAPHNIKIRLDWKIS